MTGLLSRREITIWAALFLVISAWLVAIGFASDDPDSALYAELSARLAQGSPSRWIAPEWWGQWDTEGLFREHPAGVFVVPTVLGAIGVPGVQAAYIVGILAGLASVVVIAHLVSGITTRTDARAVLVCLQLMPLASIFRIRANHEYPMLVCLLVAIVGADAVRRSWRWVWVTPVALTAALLVKGVFVLVPIIAVSLWIVLNPRQEQGSPWRPITTFAVAGVLMALTAQIYDAAYIRLTGEAFWGPYWARQLAPLTIATPVDGGSTLAHHIAFYAVRLLWHPAPWSLALLAAAWAHRRSLASDWQRLPARSARGLAFAIGCAAAIVLLLSPASRFAERYIFSANYLVAAAGIVVALHHWPRLRRVLSDLDGRVPALAAWTWFVLMALRVVVGPFLPRVSG
jgi:4-amino-4-deoxy-L-arabinose transferase-like glycosyltransferase